MPVTRYVTAHCPAKKHGKCSHYFNSAKVIGVDNNNYILECEGCNSIFRKEKAPLIVKSPPYPYYNNSIGRELVSREHEDKICKEEGFERV